MRTVILSLGGFCEQCWAVLNLLAIGCTGFIDDGFNGILLLHNGIRLACVATGFLVFAGSGSGGADGKLLVNTRALARHSVVP